MPRKKQPIRRVTTEVIEPPEDELPEDIYEDPDEPALRNFVSQFGPGDVQIKVYKASQSGKDYCYTGGTEVNEESIRASGYGAGKYLLYVMINGEFRKMIPISIAAQTSPSGGMADASAGGGMVKLLLDRLAMLETRLTHPQEREPINDLADAMLKISQIQNQSAPKDLPIDTLMKCIELGKSLGNEGGGSDFKTMLLEVLKESMPVISTMIGRAAAGSPSSVGAGEGKPAVSISDPTNPEAGVQIFEQQLKSALTYLKKKCLSGSDPGLFVDWVIENRDDTTYQYLIRATLTQEFSQFAKLDAEISQPPYEPFFHSIYDGLRSAFSSADSVATDTGGPHGNKSHGTKNGGSGKGSAK